MRKNQKPNPDHQAVARLKIIRRRDPEAAERLFLLLEIAFWLWRHAEYVAMAAVSSVLYFFFPSALGMGVIGMLALRNRHRLTIAALRFSVVAMLSCVVAITIILQIDHPVAIVLYIGVAATLTTLISSILYMLWPARRVKAHE